MNIFVIPSWYPNENSPISGIFFKEQTAYLAQENPNHNFGISHWGQSNPTLYLNKKNVSNPVGTLRYYKQQKSGIKTIYPNLTEFYTPAISWTHKVWAGNMQNIIRLNKKHFEAFQKQAGKTDLIHAHVSFPAGYIAMQLAAHYKIPYIITEHMGPFPFPHYLDRRGRLRSFLYNPLRKADKVVAVSPTLAAAIAGYGLTTPAYIPNVVDEAFFKPDDRELPEIFTFFTLCHLSPQKGIDDLLQAVKILKEEHPHIQFRIGGAGNLLSAYKSMAINLGLEQQVVWLGALSREQAREEFLNCHAFILPSHYETFGVVYAEAIACGKPVVATKCGGAEAIINQTNGLLVEVGDTGAMADSIKKLIKNYQLYSPVAIREDFLARFSKKAVLPQIINLYKSIACAE